MKRIILSFISFGFIFFSVFTYAEEKITFYHNDVLGSPVAASDIDGKLLWKEEYEPYGKRRLSQQSLNHRGYTSHVEDNSTGLVYMQARYYDPLIGRFYGIDNVGVMPGKQHSFNRYSYANNNPYKYIDPDGEWAILVAGALTLLGVVGLVTFSDYANAPGEGSVIQEKSGVEMGLTVLGGASGKLVSPLVRGGLGAGAKGLAGVPGRVQSRINVSNEGWAHVLKRHFSGKPNASQFSVSQSELQSLLQSKQVVGSPVTRTVESADGLRYVREVDVGRTIGVDAMNGNAATSVMTTMSDKYGNLITAFPGVLQ